MRTHPGSTAKCCTARPGVRCAVQSGAGAGRQRGPSLAAFAAACCSFYRSPQLADRVRGSRMKHRQRQRGPSPERVLAAGLGALCLILLFTRPLGGHGSRAEEPGEMLDRPKTGGSGAAAPSPRNATLARQAAAQKRAAKDNEYLSAGLRAKQTASGTIATNAGGKPAAKAKLANASEWASCLPVDLGIAYASLIASASGEPLWANVSDVPCRQGDTMACCQGRPLAFRPRTTDLFAFDQVFHGHSLKHLYEPLAALKPAFILDAGANAGYTTVLFKSLFPNATVVAVEPDEASFEALQLNTRTFDGVHLLNAAIRGWRTNLTLAPGWGEASRVYAEAAPGDDGVPAYSIQDVIDMLGIPGFDFIRLDIGGGEATVFAPGAADLSWKSAAKLVSVETHGRAERVFGVKDVEGLVAGALPKAKVVRASGQDGRELYALPVTGKESSSKPGGG